MVDFGGALLVLAGVALALYLFYLFYGFIHRAFQHVGFSQKEAGLILFGTLVGGLVNIPLAAVNGWILAINIGGAVVPLVVSYLLLRRARNIGLEAFVGVVLVAVVTYLVTSVTPEGIVSVFPLWLAPPLVAALMSVAALWREEGNAAAVAYIAGTVGSLVGADVLRLGEFLAQTPPEAGTASIGGASVFDMVFLAGILAVGLDMLVFRELRRAGVVGSTDGPVVFRLSTPAHIIRDYDPKEDRERVLAAYERARVRR